MKHWALDTLTGIRASYGREVRAYFATPLAYVFIAIFLMLLGFFTWEASRFFDTGAADLSPFFYWHPWLYMIFLPALSMRLWADESAGGTAELLLSMPVSITGLAIGKLLAAWTVAAVTLVFTFPMWLTVNYLGDPDNAAILLTYFMSFVMAGAYLAIGAAVSALVNSQVLAYVIGVVVAFVLTAAGWPMVLGAVSGALGPGIGDIVAKFSFLTHFETAERGVLEFRAFLYFLGVIALWVALNVLWVSHRRSAAR
ncbi:ABC transporter permease subunit [Henriciella aquimarina]|uniref:ABC transporter permease subunit n=1 Tax=Henriciella aquimarina TaxID=545261 RepID=UPI0009FC1B47|nr:ABC transporter permease subunit [Henriciella aquimarina]